MSRKVGLWIDRRRAVVVDVLDDGDTRVKTVDSDVEKHVRLAGGSPTPHPWGHEDVAAEGQADRRIEQDLQRYYAEVSEAIGPAGVIYIIGPGETKTGLLEYLDASPMHREATTEVEAADKLTQAQIVARVREHFGVAAPRWRPE